MNPIKKILTTIATSAALCAPILDAHASGAVAGATEITQIANNAELVTQVVTQAEQLAQQIAMVNDMVNQARSLPNHIWSNVAGDLQSLMNVVQQGQALAFSASNIGDVFNQRFPGYRPGTNFPTEYRNWSTTVRDTIRGALEAAGLQASQFATEELAMSQLRTMAQTSTGRMQALQVGNQIAAENAAQMQKLRGLVMAQMQSQNAYMMGQQQERDTRRGAVDALFSGGSVKTGKNYSTALGGSN